LTFGTLLSVYLTGIGVGAAIGTRLLRRIHRPAHAFLVMQAAVAIYAGLGITVLLAIVDDWRSLSWLSSYFGSYEPLDARAAVRQLGLALRPGSGQALGDGGELPARFLMLYMMLPAALILPPTLVIGSNQAIAFDAKAVRRRLEDPRVRMHYGRAIVDIESLLGGYLDRAPRVYGPSDDRSGLDDINTDLFPKDEFSVPLAR
jgi:hypothetical protein